MFTAMWIRQRFLEPLKERQRAEGRAEMISEMKEWDRRRSDAEARGEPFSETPPYLMN